MRILFIFLGTFFSFPFFSQNFVEKKVGHEFYISIPEYLEETRGLNDAAVFQYQHEVKQVYTMVIDDSKQNLASVGISFNSPEEYFRSVELFYLNEGDKPTDKIVSLTINGNNAVQAELIRPLEVVDLFYLITIIESKGYFYQVVSWTTAERKDDYKQDFIRIANSLKE